ncbi:MAG: hypothetical protein HYR80_07515 [Nitrospirae bacterium]|nr:hypothetical protein [Nitrospirota bacterium]
MIQRALSGLAVLVLFFFLFSGEGNATREFKVYPSQTAPEGEVESSFWNNYTSSNSQPYSFKGNPVSKSDLMEYSLELEYGVTDRLTIEGYWDFEQPKGESFQYVGAKAVLARYHIFQEDERFWDTSIYLEYSLPNEAYNPSEELEARLLLEKAVDRWSVRLNPILSKPVSGPEVSGGIELAYAAGIYWRMFHTFVPDLEFFGEFGELKNSPKHIHYLFPGFSVNFGTGWKWESGIGMGMTSESDRVIIKNMISYSTIF